MLGKKMRRKIALITGITGQDGSYLAEFLIKKNYIVHGIVRRSSSINTSRIDHIYQNPQIKKRNFILHFGDLTDSSKIIELIHKIKPTEIYNLGAQSHVAVSFQIPEYTANVNSLGCLRILEAIRYLGFEKKIKFYQASTSELYGLIQNKQQSEKTNFNPRSPYAVSKLFSYWITRHYREAYGIFACNGILFNHESPRRGETFVTRKITLGLAKIYYGVTDKLYMGNLDAYRDWGHAKDFVEMQWKILQQKNPEDFVIATGVSYSVRDLIEYCVKILGIDIEWKNKGLKEVGIIKKIFKPTLNKRLKLGATIIKVDKRYFRPLEVDELLGDARKAQKKLKWRPKYNFKKLINEMMECDLSIVKKKYL
jgi:GDPmannose 4,6-dehydratase